MIVPVDGAKENIHLMHTKKKLAISGPALGRWPYLGEITPINIFTIKNPVDRYISFIISTISTDLADCPIILITS